jgi:hypothetical protein
MAIGSWLVLLGAALVAAPQSRAASLAVYSFESGTNTADSVAAHLTANPVTAWNTQPHPDAAWPISYGGGSLTAYHAPEALFLDFRLELTADPGYTFQVTDTLISLYQVNYAGGGRSVVVSANGEPGVALYAVTGADGGATVDPDVPIFGFYQPAWDALTARTDLTSLAVTVSSGINGGSGTYLQLGHAAFDGNVFAVPEPSTAWLVAAGCLMLGGRRARSRAREGRSLR